MKPKKQLWLLTGGNGVGKSTFYNTRLKPLNIPFVNADILASQLYPDSPESHSYDAAIIATHMRNDLLHQGRTFCFETVFSHPSKIDFVAQAKTLEYEIVLVYIHLQSTPLNQARIAQRVNEGGHHVPAEKVESRIPRTMANVKQAIPLCDYCYLLDNSNFDNPFQQITQIHRGQLLYKAGLLPGWAKVMIDDYLR